MVLFYRMACMLWTKIYNDISEIFYKLLSNSPGKRNDSLYTVLALDVCKSSFLSDLISGIFLDILFKADLRFLCNFLFSCCSSCDVVDR